MDTIERNVISNDNLLLSKVINIFSKRVKVDMPRYDSPTIKNYKINIAPIGRWRLPFYKMGMPLPYFVGDEIKLSINLDDIKPDEQIGDTLSVWIKYPHNAVNERYEDMKISFDSFERKARLVSRSIYKSKIQTSTPGNLVVSISETNNRDEQQNILTTEIYNDDNFNYFVVWPIGIAIIGVIIGIVGTIIFR